MANGKTPTILVADDDYQTLNILQHILHGQGYVVISANDGYGAQEKILEKKPDLIILDNHMPGLTGKEICGNVKSDPRTRLIPIIMLTGFTETTEKIEVIEAGADDFVNKPFKAIELVTRIKSLLKMKFLNDELDSAEEVIFALARAIEAKDTYTQGHTERVSQFALVLAYHLGLSDEDQNALYKGGILHDIGKIAIPDAILNKVGLLTEEEKNAVRSHPDKGEKICQPLKSMKSALQVVRHHHEKFDGSGYPDGLVGDKIPLLARIMAIVDVYDALTTKRAYRPALSQDKAFAILEEEARKGWWDKEILANFRKVISV